MTPAIRTLALRPTPRARRITAHPQRLAVLRDAGVVSARGRRGDFARSAPGAVVTFAGVQGGAGVSTATLLACTAITRASDQPAIAIDLAPGTRGGLGGLTGGWSQSSAQATAELVVGGGTLARPYTETPDGAHVISEPPQARTAGDRVAHRLLDDLVAAVDMDAADHELATLARASAAAAVHDDLASAGAEVLRKLVRAARAPHSLVALDLGLVDDELLAAHATGSDLHVWVIAARREDLEIARRRLLDHESVAERELVLAWQPDAERIRARELRELGEARGCPVARLARFDRRASWADRERACASGLHALCRHLD